METSLPELVRRAQVLLSERQRTILGITGAPGSGKSTLAADLCAALGPGAVVVPMDGFHLANDELIRLGRRERKGAADTFDADGYVALLHRLHDGTEDTVYAPTFRRDIEEAIAGAIPVARDLPLVITEGNYLLVQDRPWTGIRPLLDEAWYLDPPDDVRVERLVRRHVAHGKEPAEARAWSWGPDARNAAVVVTTRARADLVIPGFDRGRPARPV